MSKGHGERISPENASTKRRRRGRGAPISISFERSRGFMTSLGPWAIFPHAEEETFWPGVEHAAPVKILNADGTVREIVSASEFRERRPNRNIPYKRKIKKSADGKFR